MLVQISLSANLNVNQKLLIVKFSLIVAKIIALAVYLTAIIATGVD